MGVFSLSACVVSLFFLLVCCVAWLHSKAARLALCSLLLLLVFLVCRCETSGVTRLPWSVSPAWEMFQNDELFRPCCQGLSAFLTLFVLTYFWRVSFLAKHISTISHYFAKTLNYLYRIPLTILHLFQAPAPTWVIGDLDYARQAEGSHFYVCGFFFFRVFLYSLKQVSICLSCLGERYSAVLNG